MHSWCHTFEQGGRDASQESESKRSGFGKLHPAPPGGSRPFVEIGFFLSFLNDFFQKSGRKLANVAVLLLALFCV